MRYEEYTDDTGYGQSVDIVTTEVTIRERT